MSGSSEALMMVHVGFGMMLILAGLWVFVDSLNANESNVVRIRRVSLFVAISMWLAFIIAGYWYVVSYGADKAIILKGPWPFAHNFFMESKEHILLMLLLLATFLPIAAYNDLPKNRSARNVVLCVAALIVLIGCAVDGSGAVIAMGAKLACHV